MGPLGSQFLAGSGSMIIEQAFVAVSVVGGDP